MPHLIIDMKPLPTLAAWLSCGFLAIHAVSIPPAEDTASYKGKITLAAGKAATLPVNSTHNAFVFFSLADLPVTQPAEIRYARLRLFFPRVTKAGTGLDIRTVSGSWSETQVSAEPAFSSTSLASVPENALFSKQFASVDVTTAVQGWISDPTSNQGFAIIATGGTNLVIGSKEGAGSGYPAVLEVELNPSRTSIASSLLASDLTLSGTTFGTFCGNGAALKSLSASNISGQILANQLASNLTLSGTTSGTFSGDGSGLTGVKADVSVSSGLVIVETPEKYGAMGDGTTDDTAALQAAVTAAAAIHGQVALAGGKTYKVSSTISATSAVQIIGVGGSAAIKWDDTFTDGDIISIAPNGTPATVADLLVNASIENVTFTGTARRTSGWCYHIKWTHFCKAANVNIPMLYLADHDLDSGGANQVWNVSAWDGIFFEKQSDCVIKDCEVSVRHYGIELTGDSSLLFGNTYPYADADGIIDNCNIQSLGAGEGGRAGGRDADARGVFLGGQTGGITLRNGNISGMAYGLYVGAGNREIFVYGTFFDSNGTGVKVVNGGATIMEFAPYWSAGNNTTGADINSNASITFKGGYSFANGGTTTISNASQVIWSDVLFTGDLTFSDTPAIIGMSGGFVNGTLTLPTTDQTHLSVRGVGSQADFPNPNAITEVATNYKATRYDVIVAVTDTSSARTITLPLASSVGGSATNAKVLTIKDRSGGAATHNITVTRTNIDTIDGATYRIISGNYGAVTFYSNGTNWFTK